MVGLMRMLGDWALMDNRPGRPQAPSNLWTGQEPWEDVVISPDGILSWNFNWQAAVPEMPIAEIAPDNTIDHPFMKHVARYRVYAFRVDVTFPNRVPNWDPATGNPGVWAGHIMDPQSGTSQEPFTHLTPYVPRSEITISEFHKTANTNLMTRLACGYMDVEVDPDNPSIGSLDVTTMGLPPGIYYFRVQAISVDWVDNYYGYTDCANAFPIGGYDYARVRDHVTVTPGRVTNFNDGLWIRPVGWVGGNSISEPFNPWPLNTPEADIFPMQNSLLSGYTVQDIFGPRTNMNYIVEFPRFTIGFTDIGGLAQHVQEEILRAAALGIVQGRGSGIFDPNALVTVQEATTMFLRVLGIPVDFDTAIQTGAAEGLVDAGVDGRAPMSRIDTARLIENALIRAALAPEITPEQVQGILAEFTDLVGLSPEELMAMAVCVEVGIFQGAGGGLMNPAETLLRSQVASLSVRLHDIVHAECED